MVAVFTASYLSVTAAFAASLLCSPLGVTHFALRNAPRTLTLAIALFFCAWVFFQRALSTRSWAARVTGASCLLYGVNQTLYTVAEVYVVFHAAHGAPAAGGWALVYSTSLLYLD